MNLAAELKLAASRHALGLLPPEEMVRLADAALSHGHYSDRMDALAMHRFSPHPSALEVAPMFLEWLDESGIPLPSAEDAGWDLSRMAIGRIVREEIPPLRGLDEVARVCRRTQDPERFGLGALYAAYLVRGEPADAPFAKDRHQGGAAEALNEQASYVRELCDTWWKVFGPSPSLGPDSPEAARLREPRAQPAAVEPSRSVSRWRERIYVVAFSVWVAIVVAAIALLR